MFQKPKRHVQRVFLHCSASDATGRAYEDGGLRKTIDEWHKARGWSEIGYHYVIDKIGVVLVGRSLEKTPAAQVGHNTATIAICCHGLAQFPEIQLLRLKKLCQEINQAYGGQITFHGHREVANKACPVYDYKTLLGLDAHGYMK